MYIEIAGIIGLIALIFCLVSEWKDRKTEGIIGGLLVLLLSLWILSDGIQMNTGQTVIAYENNTEARTYNGSSNGLGNQTDNIYSYLDPTTNVTLENANSTANQLTNYSETGTGLINVNRNETITNVYTEVQAPVLPFFTATSRLLWGLMILFIGLYLEFRYWIGTV